MHEKSRKFALYLSGAGRNLDLNTPGLTDLWDTLTLRALSRAQYNPLLGLDVIPLEQEGGCALDNLDAVGLSNLVEDEVDLALGDGLVVGGLAASGVDGCGDNQAEENLVDVVSRKQKIGLLALNDI